MRTRVAGQTERRGGPLSRGCVRASHRTQAASGEAGPHTLRLPAGNVTFTPGRCVEGQPAQPYGVWPPEGRAGSRVVTPRRVVCHQCCRCPRPVCHSACHDGTEDEENLCRDREAAQGVGQTTGQLQGTHQPHAVTPCEHTHLLPLHTHRLCLSARSVCSEG